MQLPDSDELFFKFLLPWYPNRGRPFGVRPDLFKLESGSNLLEGIQPMSRDLDEESRVQVEKIAEAAFMDYSEMLGEQLVGLALLDAVDDFFDKGRVYELIQNSDPAVYSNDLLLCICEFGALLGKLFEESGAFKWHYSQPYFDSVIFHEKTGTIIPVFDWAVKKFSETGVNDGYRAKFLETIRIDLS